MKLPCKSVLAKAHVTLWWLPQGRLVSNPNSRRRISLPGCRGFTLIELIGVLTILAILAAVLSASVIKRINQAVWTRETADLKAIADGYTQYILRAKIIPSDTTWATAVASQLSMSPAVVTNNPRRLARALLVDPSLSIGGGGLPYTNKPAGTSKPVSARVMIVSSLNLPLPVVSGVPSAANFNAAWNAADGAKPSGGSWDAWGGVGEDLRIQKLNLEPLFYNLILIDHDSTRDALYSIDGSSTVATPTDGLGWNSYYLDGTIVGLHTSSGAIQVKYLMKRDISFVFESGNWNGSINGGRPVDPLAENFALGASSFYYSANNPGAQSGGSVYSALVAMYTFLFDYSLWANECPHFFDHGTSSSPEYTLLYSIGGNAQYMDKFTGASGLIK